MLYVRSSTSMNSGIAPAWRNGFRRRNERIRHGETVSPGFTPPAISAKRNASVPLDTPTHSAAPMNEAKCSSKFCNASTADERRAVQSRTDDLHQFGFEFDVRV